MHNANEVLTMVTLHSKVRLLVKVTQGRKTQHVIDDINEKLAKDPKTFSIFIAHNIKAANNQVVGRIIKSGVSVLKFTSEENREDCFGKVDELNTELTEREDVRVLCMLAHSARFKKRGRRMADIYILLNHLRILPHVSTINIYFDEFDAYSGILLKHLNYICDYHKVGKFMLISATYSDSVFFKKIGDIPEWQRIFINDPVPSEYPTYAELNEMNKLHSLADKDVPKDLFTFVIKVVEVWKTLTTRSLYIFAPSYNKKDTHFELANMFVAIGISCVIMNSDFKGIYKAIEPGVAERYPFDDLISSELSETILKAKRRYNITGDLVVTGNQCLNRAVTLQCEDLVFDIGIIHDDVANNGDGLYQADRTRGMVRRFGNKVPTLFCSEKVKKQLLEKELSAQVCGPLGVGKSTKQFALESKRSVSNVIKLGNVIGRYNCMFSNEQFIKLTGQNIADFCDSPFTDIFLQRLGLKLATGFKGINPWRSDRIENGKYKSSLTKMSKVWSLEDAKINFVNTSGNGLLGDSQVQSFKSIIPCDELIAFCRFYPVYDGDDIYALCPIITSRKVDELLKDYVLY